MTLENVLQTKLKMKKLWVLAGLSTLTLGAVLSGCGGGDTQTSENSTEGGSGKTEGAPTSNLSGSIKVDGSSTVFPITEAVAEEFGKLHPKLKVTVGVSGTGGGFKKFAAGDTAITNASRPIKDKEAAAAKAKGTGFIELPIAYDGLSVIVSKKNTFAKCLTTEELKKIWDKGSKVNNWSQVRQGFPNQPLKLYGAGTDSGTFDYFTDEINGEEGRSRSDYTASEDDNTLVQGVSKDANSLGYFGFAYYEENADKLNLVQVDSGGGCVEPTEETINTGKYAPLSRPLFIYVSSKHMEKPEVREFITFYLDNAPEMVKSVGYVPLPDSVYAAAKTRFEAKTMGTVYAAKDAKKKTLEQLYAATP